MLMMMRTRRRPRRLCGFTLLEVMVALAVTAFGLLGLAKLQAAALTGAKTANSRSIAANEAEGMASAMHANTAYWQSSAAVTASPVTVTTASAPSTGTWVDCSAQVCNATQVATYDLETFGQQVNNLLPAPVTGSPVSISCSNVSGPNICTITVSWSEQYAGSANVGALKTTQSTQNYLIVTQP